MIDGATLASVQSSLTSSSILVDHPGLHGFSYQNSGHSLYYDGHIDTNLGKSTGDITLTLIDSNGKSDQYGLTVNIEQPVKPTLAADGPTKIDLVPGTSHSWTMPALVKGTYDLATRDASSGKIFDDTEVE